jgi:hypothetical protein
MLYVLYVGRGTATGHLGEDHIAAMINDRAHSALFSSWVGGLEATLEGTEIEARGLRAGRCGVIVVVVDRTLSGDDDCGDGWLAYCTQRVLCDDRG